MTEPIVVTSEVHPSDGRHVVRQGPMRRAIARRMTESKQRVPHFYLSTEIEMDPLFAVGGAPSTTVGPARTGHGDGVPDPGHRPHVGGASGLQ